MQVMLSNGDPTALRQLSRTLNVSMAKAGNRPLQSLSQNANQVRHTLPCCASVLWTQA